MASSSFCDTGFGKSSWPELLGAYGRAAAAVIQSENTSANAVVVLEGTGVTEDINCTRVRVWVNESGIVTRVPQLG